MNRYFRHPANLAGAISFLLLLLLALVFYLERIGHIDMAFQTFLILRNGAPDIQSGRFGAVATQVWPWAAQAMHLPLRGVLLAYSVGHIVWPALLFVWCMWLRQWQWALVLLLVVTGMPTHTFYWLSEMPQGLVFLVALFAWMSAKGSLDTVKIWQWPLWVAAVVTAFYFHPLVMYAAVFGCLYFIVRSFETGGNNAATPFRKRNWPVYGFMLLVFALTTLVKFKVLKLDWYDAAALKRSAAFRELWPNWFGIPSFQDLASYLFRDYWFVPLGLTAALGFFLLKKRYRMAALVAGYPVLFSILVNVPYHESTHQFYMENLWLPLGFFTAIPLVFDVLPAYCSEKRTAWIVGAITLLGIVRIGLAHRPWTERLNWERQLLHQTKGKLLLTEQQAPMNQLKLSWSSPYEFLMLSSLESPDSARCIIITNEPQRYDSTLMAQPRMFLGAFKNYPFEALPERYFHFHDTSAYQPLR